MPLKKFWMSSLFVGVLFAFNNAQADSHDYSWAYSRSSNNDPKYATHAWMSALPDSAKIRKMSIPGTHDSFSSGSGAALADTDFVQTQTLPVGAQLSAGIRYLDVRCALKDGTLKLYHGIVDLYKTCEAGLKVVVEFLKKNPTETVLVKIQQEHTRVGNNEFGNAFSQMMENIGRNYVWQGYEATQDPTLGEARGKIIVVQRFDEYRRRGLVYSGFDVLDNYSMSTNWDLYSHWQKIKERLASFDGKDSKITNIVGSGGSFPYFVASGRSSPYGSHLVTGLTTPGWSSSYPDFPRGACFIGICSIYFSGLNELTAWYLDTKRTQGYVGIVVADFPSDRFIELIVSQNAKSWGGDRYAEKGDVFVYKNPYTSTTEYFSAKQTGSYWYFPIDRTDNYDWKYMGRIFPRTPTKVASWKVDGRSFANEVFAYANPFSASLDYFSAVSSGEYAKNEWWFPVDQTSNAHWKYLGHTAP